jgi:hypothetical protein
MAVIEHVEEKVGKKDEVDKIKKRVRDKILKYHL